MMVGQSIGMIYDLPTCAELLEKMMAEAVARIQKLSGRL
jgi:NAD(P)H-dependent flavin oxidoreductase YrpB (nitropropane dioxygenase family)